MAQGEPILAKVRAKFNGEGTSEWSEPGTGATIPITSSFENASAWVLEQPIGFDQAPHDPTYNNPLTAIQEWSRVRFDFEFGCEMSDAIKGMQDDAPLEQLEDL